MGALLSTIRSTLNLLLPFTSPDTPLIQDLIHTSILLGTFYFGPQIAEFYNAHRNPPSRTSIDTTPPAADPIHAPVDDLPLDENFVLQPDTDNDDVEEPPPLAPTPPPGVQDDAAGGAWLDAPPANDPFAAGPANPNANPNPDRPRATPANRVVGTKKAKSLARRDQRRAYHEFHRSQAEQRKREEEEGREEREAALAEKKAKRAEVERGIAEKKRVELERRKEEERREIEEERERRERVVECVRQEVDERGAVDLVNIAWEEGKDKLWIERLVRASGMLAQLEKKGQQGLLTESGWLVRLDENIMQRAYAEAAAYGDAKDGRLDFDELGTILEKAVMARAAAA